MKKFHFSSIINVRARGVIPSTNEPSFYFWQHNEELLRKSMRINFKIKEVTLPYALRINEKRKGGASESN